MGVLSAGFGFLMIAVLVPGSAMGSAISLSLAAVATVLSLKHPNWTVVATGFACAAIGLGTQSALQTALAGAIAVIALLARFAPVAPDARVIAAALAVGAALGIAVTLIPVNVAWLALAAPVLVVLLFAAVVAPVFRDAE